jgi:hypothetical protein
MPFAIPLVEFLFADTPNVRNIVILIRRGASCRIVIALIQAQVLRRIVRRLRPIHNDRLNGLSQQLAVVDVGTGHNHAQRPPVGLDDQTALGAVFRTIRGVGTDMVPPKRALPIAPSALCHRQSTPSNSSQSLTSVAQIRSRTPFSTHR